MVVDADGIGAVRELAVLLLGTGFWFVYAAPSVATACPTAPSRRVAKTLLWAGAVVMSLVLSSGWWGGLIV